MAFYNINCASFAYLTDDGLPRLYKVGFSDHTYSFPCSCDQIYAWEAQSASEVPTITLPGTYGNSPTITKNSFDANTFVAIYDILNGGTWNGAVWKNNTRLSDDITFEHSSGLNGEILAHVGLCFPSTGRYTDNTNHTSSYLYGGMTAHIEKARAAQYPKGVVFDNVMVFSASSSTAVFAVASDYYRYDASSLKIHQNWAYRTGYTTFTASGSSEKFYIVKNSYSYSATDERMTSADLDNATGNGIGVKYTTKTTLKFYACYMGARSL